MAAILIFTCRVKNNVGIMITLCFKTWLYAYRNCLSMTNIKNYMILGYNNRGPAPMAAILNKKISSAGIFEDFSPGC